MPKVTFSTIKSKQPKLKSNFLTFPKSTQIRPQSALSSSFIPFINPHLCICILTSSTMPSTSTAAASDAALPSAASSAVAVKIEGTDEETRQFLDRGNGDQVIVRMRGLPFDTTKHQIVSSKLFPILSFLLWSFSFGYCMLPVS